ncbi:MAG: hypothetical protein RBU25_05720 [Lentisphaeria bacterium]|jgi:hypothetical protein|nr:hypothetical protein [Lentisphaeria bacterium]
MKAEHHSKETLLAWQAMRRAARKVLSEAVQNNRPIPLWDGTKVVWKVPKEELEQLDSQASTLPQP